MQNNVMTMDLVDGGCHAVHEEYEMFPSETPILCKCLPKVGFSFPALIPPLTPLFPRINVKLGGINTVPDPASVSILVDPRNPTIVMGMYLAFCQTRCDSLHFVIQEPTSSTPLQDPMGAHHLRHLLLMSIPIVQNILQTVGCRHRVKK